VKRIVAALVLGVSLPACGGSGNPAPMPTAPTAFTVGVSSPDSMVYFTATEQMTAVASDGRALTGTWTTDNPSVATVSPTGLVTPTGAGQSTVIFTASTGQTGSKLLRALPDLNGTFTGQYAITFCAQNGQVADSNLCGVFPIGSQPPYTFNWTQSADKLSGRFFLGTTEFDNITSTIDLGGNFSFESHAAGTGTSLIDATWNAFSYHPNTLGGNLTTIWTAAGLSGQANINGLIINFNKTASVPRPALPLTPGMRHGR
jgi:Bacterial Ig-like domain (group 2)